MIGLAQKVFMDLVAGLPDSRSAQQGFALKLHCACHRRWQRFKRLALWMKDEAALRPRTQCDKDEYGREAEAGNGPRW